MWIDGITAWDVAVMAALAVCTAWVALLCMSGVFVGWQRASLRPTRAEVAFLFEGQTLVDATPAARRLLDVSDAADTDLARLARFLSPRFPKIFALLADQAGELERVHLSSDGLTRLRVHRVHGARGRLRMRLEDALPGANSFVPDRHSLTAIYEELQMHRVIAGGVLFPMWRQTPDGQITWANAEYRRLEGRLGLDSADAVGPSRIFREEIDLSKDGRHVQRAKVELPGEADARWFEFQVNWAGEDLLIAAVPIDRIVRAERSLNGFVQSLTQTFAHLNVGLAVFNRTRELAIFNPALSDLLGLPPEFLVTRPSLFQLFDRLRDQRMVPEPKDNKSWHRKMSALEAAASDSDYSETWSLVDGRTFRVTGRPHPEGAVAFIFEDISQEIQLERRFRTELQMGHAVLDGLEEAIAVFSSSGALLLANKAYKELWGAPAPSRTPSQDPSQAREQLSFVDASRAWQAGAMPTPVWGDARDFAATYSERTNWTAEIRLRDGRPMLCRFDALPGGYTLVGFSEIVSLQSAPHAPIAASATQLRA